MTERTCRACGCTQHNACVNHVDGACWWISEDLCSHCQLTAAALGAKITVADDLGSSAAACLLTGMGRDGADGLLAVRRAGGRTIAQDEATSVVYGMPREAALLGAAEQVLPLDQVAPALCAFARTNVREGPK